MQWRINIPPLTRILLALLLVISSVDQIIVFTRSSDARLNGSGSWNFLSLIPQQSVFYPWVFFTATFAERNLLTLVIAGGTVLYGGKYLERAWDTREFGKFVLVVTLLPNLAASLIYVLWFAISRNDSHMYVVDVVFACLKGKLIPLQLDHNSRVSRHTSCILGGIQATGAGTHRHNLEGPDQDPRQALSLDFPGCQHPIWRHLGDRQSARTGLAWLLYELDISAILQNPDRSFRGWYRGESHPRRCFGDFRFCIFLARCCTTAHCSSC